MTSKYFKEELESLRSGLASLNKLARETTERRIFEKAIKNIEIQKERIEWFNRGYNLCEKEIAEQRKLT